MTLEICRQRIDALDQQLLELLNERACCVEKIGELKRQENRPILDKSREQEIIHQITSQNHGPLSNEAITNIFRVIIQEGRRLQKAEEPTN
jgi:chorismate mutase-like protein